MKEPVRSAALIAGRRAGKKAKRQYIRQQDYKEGKDMISKTEVIEEFKTMLQTKVDEYLAIHCPNQKELVTIKPGKKYIKIDVSSSGKFMFDTKNCHLYFIKGYGVIDWKKDFGSLLLIIQKDFDWDGYSIIPKGMAQNYRSRFGYAGKIA